MNYGILAAFMARLEDRMSIESLVDVCINIHRELNCEHPPSGLVKMIKARLVEIGKARYLPGCNSELALSLFGDVIFPGDAFRAYTALTKGARLTDEEVRVLVGAAEYE